ncbi:MAG: hypothetical protein CMK09_02810 [Ponticaulis sp.]|nr:hypothetical protein [Ponticaulis sp.]|tara:strand:- start:11207 stop:12385 length:1179 start_codon:yes stop_codon:yes gene_type:complete
MTGDAYFSKLADALKQAGIATPRLVVDRARLDANIATLTSLLPQDMALRVVVKSLPSPELVSRIMKKVQTDRLMTFNLPMLKSFAEHYPMADQLLGKPLPAAAMDQFFIKNRPRNAQSQRKVQWLVDTPRRLSQYLKVAERHGATIRVNLELDVGFHRGGFTPGDDLNTALETLHDSPFGEFSGLMGYEPHIPALDGEAQQDAARRTAFGIYQAALTSVLEHAGSEDLSKLTLNAAGSPTFRLWSSGEIANEVAIGSALVKPTNFDTDLLAPFQPASFIATPILKTWKGLAVPGEAFDPATIADDAPVSVFTYGGYWKAKPVYPAGVSYNAGFGRSSNQDLLIGPSDLSVEPDDMVILRPRQSESVFLQFGPILVYDDGQIVDEWPVLPASP